MHIPWSVQSMASFITSANIVPSGLLGLVINSIRMRDPSASTAATTFSKSSRVGPIVGLSECTGAVRHPGLSWRRHRTPRDTERVPNRRRSSRSTPQERCRPRSQRHVLRSYPMQRLLESYFPFFSGKRKGLMMKYTAASCADGNPKELL